MDNSKCPVCLNRNLKKEEDVFICKVCKSAIEFFINTLDIEGNK